MKLTKDYMTIETAEEAAVFKVGAGEHHLLGDFGDSLELYWSDDILLSHVGTAYPCRFTRAEVKEATTQKKGDAVLFCDIDKSAGTSPTYHRKWTGRVWHWHQIVKANALTIGKTVGEIRRLIEWTEDE